MADQIYEYSVVTIPANLVLRSGQPAGIVLTAEINNVAQHGWRLIDGPTLFSGPANMWNLFTMTFERPKVAE
jgi:hypothetical protein